MNQDFLFELGCEELPAGELESMAQYLNQSVRKALETAKLSFGNIKTLYTPRRLTYLVYGVQLETPAQVIERRGPAKNAPAQAIEGFLKSCNASREDLIEVETDKGTWLAVKINQPAVSAKVILKEAIETAIKTMPLKKVMRWSNHDFSFLRPVHWLVALLGEDIVPIELFGLKAGRLTLGHRFHHPGKIAINHPRDYIDSLRKAYVLVDRIEREETILKAIKSHTSRLGKLDEVLNLVEWPVPLLCHFEKEFLHVPQEVLITTMEANQRVFPVVDAKGKLQNQFWVIANIESKDPQSVIHGNEKVVRARLADAKFFYDEDLKVPLENHLEGLRKITFQQGLGSLFDKVIRLDQLSVLLIRVLAGDIIENYEKFTTPIRNAAKLCKTDLVTNMVQEFPELQGYMGEQYAKAQGESGEVAIAIREHYLPKGRGGELPQTEIAIVLALADKIDTLVGMFAIGKEPTSSGDPFALRRQALGVITILVNQKSKYDLDNAFQTAFNLYSGINFNRTPETLIKLRDFFDERLINWFREEHPEISTKNVQAIVNTQRTSAISFDAYGLFEDIMAFDVFIQTREGKALIEIAKRIANIIDVDEYPTTEPDSTLFGDAENQLWSVVQMHRYGAWRSAPINERYLVLLELYQPIAAFFNAVRVNDLDPTLRANRQNLLKHIHVLFKYLADFSKL